MQVSQLRGHRRGQLARSRGSLQAFRLGRSPEACGPARLPNVRGRPMTPARAGGGTARALSSDTRWPGRPPPVMARHAEIVPYPCSPSLPAGRELSRGTQPACERRQAAESCSVRRFSHRRSGRTGRPASTAAASGAEAVTHPALLIGGEPVEKPASTCASSPGPRSSGTGWWQERRPRTTRACPNTGPAGAMLNRPPGMSATTLRLLRVQRGRCPLCQGLLLHADREPQNPREWEQWLTATRKAIRHHAVTVWGQGHRDERAATRLIHTHCRRRATRGAGGTAPLHAAREPSGSA